MVKFSGPFDLDLERYGAFLRIDLDLSFADFDHILVVAVVSVIGAALALLYDLMVFQKEVAIVQEKVQVVRQRKARRGGEGESQVHFRQVVIHVLVVDFQIAFHGVGPECVSFLGRAVGGAGKRDVHVPFGVEKHSVFLFVLDDLAEIRAGVLDVLEIGLFGQVFVADVRSLKWHRPPGPGGRSLKDLVKGNEAVVVEIAGTRIDRGVKAESEKREAEIGSVGILVGLAGGQEERVLLEVRDHVPVEFAVFFRLLCRQFRSHAFREHFGLVYAGDHAAGEAGVQDHDDHDAVLELGKVLRQFLVGVEYLLLVGAEAVRRLIAAVAGMKIDEAVFRSQGRGGVLDEGADGVLFGEGIGKDGRHGIETFGERIRHVGRVVHAGVKFVGPFVLVFVDADAKDLAFFAGLLRIGQIELYAVYVIAIGKLCDVVERIGLQNGPGEIGGVVAGAREREINFMGESGAGKSERPQNQDSFFHNIPHEYCCFNAILPYI